jgi:hypothetical protein
LDAIAKRVAQKRGERESVLHASKNRVRYTSVKTDWDAMVGLERYLGEQVNEMLKLIESVNSREVPLEVAEEVLLGVLWPTFQPNFELMKSKTPQFAEQCMKQYRTFLLGPPNCRTQNYLEFRDYVLNLLQMCV